MPLLFPWNWASGKGISLSRGLKEIGSNWVSAPLHQSIICSVCIVLVQSLKICFDSCLHFALCRSVGGETSQDLCLVARLCGSGAAPLRFSCLSGLVGCQDPSHQVQRGL